ncbi:MAG: GNAT family N-acetyltransferase [Saprospiraceae bacterium]
MIKIISFRKKYQESVNSLVAEIAKEFQNPISKPFSNIRKKIVDKYWIAIKEDMVIGTIAILKIENRNSILKKMFVHKKYRGKEKGISNLLLETAFQWCQEEGISKVYLGTMVQFKGAHRFYEKNGFQEIRQSELPVGFVHNPIDDIFYRKNLSTWSK